MLHTPKSEAPQHVILHRRKEVVLTTAEPFAHLQGGRNGEALIAAMQQSPYRDIDLDIDIDIDIDVGAGGLPMPVRGVDL
jgi:hypothetical protein